MKSPVVSDESMEELMADVVNKIDPIFKEETTPAQTQALNTFFMTLAKMTQRIFDWLPDEHQGEILVNCGTWFDVGLLFGRSPELLVKILNDVDPKMNMADVPAWMGDFIDRKKQGG